MNAIRETQKKYCSSAMGFAIPVGFLLIFLGQSAIGKGLVLGTLFSVLNFIIMGEVLPSKIGLTRKKTYTVAFGSVIFRYIVLAIPLVLGMKFTQFNIWAVIAGIFMVQIMIVGDHLKDAIFSTRKV